MKYLITGGTGLVGQKLTKLLIANNHKVSVLSRTGRRDTEVSYFKWDLKNDYVDPEALKGVDCVIHLAGAGIVDEKWTVKRKKEIIDSRVKPLKVLAKGFKGIGEFPKTLISASAIGIYGFDTGEVELKEDARKGKDYISEVVIKWEKAVDDFTKQTGCRSVKLRIGIVLDVDGGALPSLALPVKLGVGSAIGDGQQWLSWIHVNDLIDMFLVASENKGMAGAFNAVAPDPVRNRTMVTTLGRVLKRPVWAPKVPGFVLKALLGSRAQLVLGGNKVSAKKMLKTGFTFEFDNLESALTEIYNC
ncbi:MAG: hypothetical protein ACI9DJ_001495 [Algoriphagus sp.]|jgi:uncharacterized protein (TIGR01777 family)